MAVIILNGQRLTADTGETIFVAAQRSTQAAREIASSCPGAGRCRECVVEIRSGHDALTPPTPAEAFLEGSSGDEARVYRLACQAAVLGDAAVIEVETFKRRLHIATSGRPALDAFDPWVRRNSAGVECDGRRLTDWTGPLHGLAIDVGTTTVVMHVVSLDTGETVDVQAFENPQRFGGSDVLHRISYDGRHPGQLHHAIVGHVNHVLGGLSVDPQSIFAVTVAGNPTMRDLFFGLDVQGIGVSPFMSRTQAALLIGERDSTSIGADAGQLNLAVHPQARVYGLPLISHHVGADTAAVLATIPAERPAGPFVMIDIGTNTEVVMGDGDRLVAASCAAGPAFEGGRVRCGMAACDGAISEMRRRGGSWELSLIGEGPARGICGSGLVDLLAELRRTDEMDALGRFAENVPAIDVSADPPVVFTRADASELALTKAAIGLGQAVLLRRLGITPSEIGTYYLAGAFANRINLASGRDIGLFLPVPDDRVVRIGNASVEGAKAALVSRSCRQRIEALVKRIEHVQLEKEPDFFHLYAETAQFQPLAVEIEQQ